LALKSSVNKLRQLKTSFASGELDPLMNMRSDTGAYANGAKQLKNLNILPQGGVERRAGTKLLTALTGDARLIAFDFDDNEQYIIAFGHQRADVWYLETNAIVASITSAPWTSSIIYQLNIAQSGDTMIVCHPTMTTQIIKRTSLTAFNTSNFAFDGDDENVYQPYYKFADASVTLAVSGISGSKTVTASADHFTSNHVNTYLKINKTSLKITGVTNATTATATIFGTLDKELIENALTSSNGTKLLTIEDPLHGLVDGATVTITGANSIANIDAGDINASHSITVNNDDQYQITVGGSNNANATTAGGGPLIKVSAANATNTEWKEQSYSDERGYPASVTFHDGRLWFGGSRSQPDWLWSSKVDFFFNFDTGEGEDDESIQSSIGMDRVADIRHLISNRHLQVFTANAEFFCPQGDTSVLTPENFNIRRQTTYGSNFVNAKAFDGGTIFVQKSGRTVRELLFTDTELAYSANSLSLLSTHLVQTPNDLAIFGGSNARPEQYALFVNTDGTIANFHSVRAEKLAGWTHWSQTGATFKSVEAVGTRCFFTVLRGSSYFLEELGDATDTLDHSTTKTISSAGLSFTGLTAYNNQTVKVRSGTYYLGEFVISGSGVLTLSAGMECKEVTVGYDYVVTAETMPVEVVLSTGSLRGQPKRISRVILGLDSSLSSTLEGSQIILRQVTDDFSIAPSAFTGLKEFYVLGYGRDRSITIKQTDPLPMRVTGLVMEYGF